MKSWCKKYCETLGIYDFYELDISSQKVISIFEKIIEARRRNLQKEDF